MLYSSSAALLYHCHALPFISSSTPPLPCFTLHQQLYSTTAMLYSSSAALLHHCHALPFISSSTPPLPCFTLHQQLYSTTAMLYSSSAALLHHCHALLFISSSTPPLPCLNSYPIVPISNIPSQSTSPPCCKNIATRHINLPSLL